MKTSESPWDRSFRSGSYVDSPQAFIRHFYDQYRNLLRGANVLDAGCGHGNNTIYLAQNGLDVVALDYSKEALEILEERIRNQPYKNRIQLVRGSLDNLPFRDEYFDLVVSTSVIHHTKSEKRKEWINNINRVLKKYGLFVLSVLSKRDPRYKTGREVEPNTLVGIQDTFDGQTPHHFYSPNQIKREIGGLEEREILSLIDASNIQSLRENRFEVHKTPLKVDEIVDKDHGPFTHIYVWGTKGNLIFVPPHLIKKL